MTRRAEPVRLRDLDLERHLREPSIKQRYVTALFDLLAPRYDRFTRWFSFGMDRVWKRDLLTAVRSALGRRAVVLDVACGTGDLAHAVAAMDREARVLGVDRSCQMLRQARGRGRRVGSHGWLCLGDVMALPVRDASVDVVTVGYGLRNSPDVIAALHEIARVIRPGGYLFTLDFYLPDRWLWRHVFLRYLALAGGLYGWLWHREPVAYGYIAKSIEHFVTPAVFGQALSDTGFEVLWSRRRLLGGICLHGASKPAVGAGLRA